MISNDVNVIFAFLDIKHKFHIQSSLFVVKNQRRKLVVLANVMKSFLKTYKNYIVQVGAIIEHQVVFCKEERKKSPIKNPSTTHIAILVNAGINNELKTLSSMPNYSFDALLRFKDLLLTDFSIPQLYFEENAIGEFREKFIDRSEKFSLDSINEFVTKFNQKRIMKQNDYKNYENFLSDLKSMKDYEDRRICAELFCFGEEKKAIQFLTFDNTFKQYLRKFGSKHNVKVLSV